MANQNNERSNDIWDNMKDSEQYYEQKYLEILKIQREFIYSENYEKLFDDETFLNRTDSLTVLNHSLWSICHEALTVYW